MKLQYLKMKGFRKYKEQFEIKFDNETYIIGGNAKGKSTIAYAVVWTFLGTDLRGNDKISMINNDSSDCYTELGFIGNDNKEHILIRYKHRKYSAKNYLALDGLPIKQRDLEKFYINTQLFLSIFNPDYFKDSSPAKQKELMDKYLPIVNIEDVINKLEDYEKEKINNINGNIPQFITETNLRIKDAEKLITLKNGNIEYAKSIINEQIGEEKEFLKQEELDLLYQEKDFLETENQYNVREKLQNTIAEFEAEQMNIQNKLDRVLESGKKVRIEYNQILSNPFPTCPCCEQIIKNENKGIALENKRKEMFSLADNKKVLEDELSSINLKIIQSKMQLNSIKETDKTRINEVIFNIAELEKEKSNINKFNQEIKLKVTNIEKAKQDVISLVAEIENLQENIEYYELQKIIAQKLYYMIIQEKMEIAKQYLKNAEIQFYELVKSTGEIKDCFKITRNGEEFNSLSKSQKFVTILEICNMLNKISNLNLPILIDDSESYPDFDFKYNDFNTQLIIIKAKKNRLLKISNKDDNVQKVKTLKSYTKLKEYKNVA